jgi:hypothetical protein
LPSAITRWFATILLSISVSGSWSTSTCVQIEERVAEGVRREERDLLGGELLRGHQALDERNALLRRIHLDGVRIGLHEAALAHERAPEGAEVGGLGGHGKGF